MRKVFFTKCALIGIYFLIFAIPLFLIVKSNFLRKVLFRKDKFEIGDIIRYFPFSKENSLKEWEEIERMYGFVTLSQQLLKEGDCEDFSTER